jgi:hypothetical protein
MKVTVYKMRFYDVQSDTFVVSRRMATEEGARFLGGKIIPSSAAEIDDSELEPQEQWTSRNFNPSKHPGGIQKQVY